MVLGTESVGHAVDHDTGGNNAESVPLEVHGRPPEPAQLPTAQPAGEQEGPAHAEPIISGLS